MGHSRQKSRLFLVICVTISLTEHAVLAISQAERRELREKVLEMFNHGFGSYMEHAYPADELMPLSCRGRHRGTKPSRGDIDDSLGNFSLTLVDSLDTLAVLGLLDQFDDAVRKVIRDVTFDRDIIVSVFETNIRVLGGLLGGHVMADYIKKKDNKHMQWYNNELLEKAKDLGYRLLPAFNTTTGMPYPRVNLRYGIHQEQSRAGRERDTCTACAGTMILEFAALSRLTGEPLFEARAHTALEYLWRSRHRSSNLVGTTINIHNGEWVRRESGVGAGIDSYYEYLLKAYILLGDDTYLERFNKHYEAINKYVMQGPLLVDVHMHRPLTNSRNFMDALLAFWPGLQVLKGDLKQAIETHEMLYQVTQRHNFLPEAFTTDFRVHWAQHPLRPEFVESTYFLFKATNDPHYLEVGRSVLQNLEKHARVPCGFAAIKDVTTGAHEDQMDSFVLAETFKYLYLLFSEKDEVMVDVDNYIFTTEAHLLPLTLSMQEAPELNFTKTFPKFNYAEDDTTYERSCRNTNEMFPGGFVENVRFPLKNLVENLCPKPKGRRKPRMRANSFIAGDTTQLQQLNKMGIKIVTMTDGRVQLLHTAADAGSPDDAEDGMLFMQEMIELSKSQAQEAQQEPRVVQLIGPPHNGKVIFNAGPAQFGLDLKVQPGVEGEVLIANPLRACQPLHNVDKVQGRIVVMERGDCMFVDKARNIQVAGALGGIIVDNVPDSSSFTAPLFAMSGDGKDDISIPLVFLFTKEYKELKHYIDATPALKVYLGYSELKGEPSSTTSQPAMSGAKLSGSSNSPPPPTPAEESFSMTYHTPAGQPLFTVSQDTAKKLRLTIDKTTIKEAGKARMATALEQVVQLIQTNPNFGKMNLKEQSDYLFTLGKLMEASFLSTDSQTDFEKKIMDILQERIPGNLENLGRSAATKPKDPAGHDFSGVLDEYINEQISKVFDEARSFLKTVEDVKPGMPEIELLRKEVEAKEEGKGSSLLDIPDTTTMDSPGGKELPSYASQEELSDTEGSQQQVIKKAPSWLKLGPGEVFITQEGVIYTNEGYDQEEEDGEDSGIEEEEEEMRERRQQITGVRYSKSMAEDYLNQVRNEQVESAKLTETGLRDLEPEILGGKTNQDDSLEDIEWESVSQPETNDALTSENRHNAAVIEDSSAASPETPGGDNKKKGNDEL